MINRRQLLAKGAAAGGAAAAGVAAAGAARAAQGGTLPLTPQLTQGPYYLPNAPLRADLAAGQAGVRLDMRFLVVDPSGAPVAGARAEVWHCDAKGRYSGFGGSPGEAEDPAVKAADFLRGALVVGEDGTALFHTVYPGWYTGRTAHIHFKVWVGDRQVLTGQVFLPDALSEFLYTQAPDYRRERLRDTFNRDDTIALMGGERLIGSLREADDRYVASLTLVVDPRASPQPDPGMGGPPPDRVGGPPHPSSAPPPGGGPFAGPPPGPPPRGFAAAPSPGSPPGRDALTGAERIAALLPRAASGAKLAD